MQLPISEAVSTFMVAIPVTVSEPISTIVIPIAAADV
jgi:hypothetical protein